MNPPANHNPRLGERVMRNAETATGPAKRKDCLVYAARPNSTTDKPSASLTGHQVATSKPARLSSNPRSSGLTMTAHFRVGSKVRKISPATTRLNLLRVVR